MAFGKIRSALAVPPTATAKYTFHAIALTPPPSLICRYAGDSTPGFQEAEWAFINASRTMREDKFATPEKSIAARKMEAKLFAEYCVVSWTGVYEDGEADPAPCTPTKVYEFLCAVIEADDGLAEFARFAVWIQNKDVFRTAPALGDVVALKKA